ncbi:MAG: hypothetical protein KC591_16365 [Gemmatimonadetes bacterium]|nr:hypothetical protein [Gemmatimonadota bacterium]
MKKMLILAGAVLALAAGTAPAAQQNVIHLSGNAWETGGFPASFAGDELQMVGVINQIVAPLFWSPTIYSYTYYFRDLISLGETVYGTTRVVTYDGGKFSLHVDWLPSNADYGVNPPNATSPSTFTDGHSVYLEADVSNFILTYRQDVSSGSFVGELSFTGGNAYPQLQSPDGWAVAAHIAGVSPVGYDLEVNGIIYVDGPLAVDSDTWGGVKALYR